MAGATVGAREPDDTPAEAADAGEEREDAPAVPVAV
jgi:hypothetical protein